MLSPWHWISSVCRQKRFLLVLCTFGSSFLLLNYSLLSSQSSLPTIRSSTSTSVHRQVSTHSHNDASHTKNNSGTMAVAEENLHKTDLSKAQEEKDMIRESQAGQGETNFSSGKKKLEGRGGNVIFVDANLDNHTESSKVTPNDIYPKAEKIEIMMGFPSISSSSSPQTGESIMTSSISSSSSSSSTIPPPIAESSGNILTNYINPHDPHIYSSPSSKLGSGTDRHKINDDTNNSGGNDYSNSNFLKKRQEFYSSLPSPFHIPPCNSPTHLRRVQKRKKNLAVIENFITGWNRVKCNKSITYSTHGDYRYLDNLVPLVDRWDGPISLALYAPGTDLETTLKIISYLKLCTTSKIDEWVTFHLIYDIKFLNKPIMSSSKSDILWLDEVYRNGKWKNCSEKPTFSKGDHTFRLKNGLLYPINIARNIARAAATTHFVLASDIELYPSINLIPSFMKMLQKLQREEEARVSDYERVKTRLTAAAAAVMAKLFNGGRSTINDGGGDNERIEVSPSSSSILSTEKSARFSINQDQHSQVLVPKHVFVLPVFEVKKEIIPCQVETKEQLTRLLKSRNAALFHAHICPQCHSFPKFEEWKSSVSYGDSQSNSSVPKTSEKIIDQCNNKSGNSSSFVSRNEKLMQSSSQLHSMRIFHKAKRKFPYQLWEPIFIGTKDEPIYDERLSWEGLRDKMVLGYIMCALDYDFYILDNAFLVHKPGIRKVVHLVTKTVQNQDRLINYRIRAELLKKFGKHDECVL